MATKTKAQKSSPPQPAEEGVHLAPLMMLQNMINQDFERFLSRFGVSSVAQPGRPFGSFHPGINVTAKGNFVYVEAELPGLSPSDVQLTLENNILTIQGERMPEESRKDHHSYRREFGYGAFHRVVTLPGKPDPDRVQATFRNGILEVVMPLLPEEPTALRRIPILAG